MPWYENHDAAGKARFIPAQGEPEIVWPSRGFHADATGGYGTDCVTNSRYDVLAKDNPPWASAVLAAAVAAKMPLRARKVGSACKYRFWSPCAETPAEAEADSIRIMEEVKKRNEERDVALLKEYYPLAADEAVVLPDGDIVLAEAAQYRGRKGYFGAERRMLLDGAILPLPEGAAVQVI